MDLKFYKIFIILIVISSVSCSDIDNQENNSNHQEKHFKTEKIKEENIILEPLFLNLSPKMNNTLFDKLKENNNSELINGNFIVSSNNSKLAFEIKKLDNCIKLSIIEGVKSYRYYELNSSISKIKIENNSKVIDDLVKKYSKKYNRYYGYLPLPFIKTKNEFEKSFENLDESYKTKFSKKFWGYKNKFIVFKDSIKTIIIQYKKVGELIYSDDELKSKIDYSKNTFIPKDYFSNEKDLYMELERQSKLLHPSNYEPNSFELARRESEKMSFQKLIRTMVRADLEEEAKRLYGLNHVMTDSEDSVVQGQEKIVETVDVGHTFQW